VAARTTGEWEAGAAHPAIEAVTHAASPLTIAREPDSRFAVYLRSGACRRQVGDSGRLAAARRPRGHVVGRLATLGGVQVSFVKMVTAFVGAGIAHGMVRSAARTVTCKAELGRARLAQRAQQDRCRQETLA
jgi:hypothetical protein